MQVQKILFITFSLIGLVCLVIGLSLGVGTRNFIARAEEGNGQVMELAMERSSDDGNISFYYYPIIRFSTNTGEVITFQSSVGSNPPSYQVGDVVQLLYAKEQPEKVRINSFTSLWLLPIIPGGIGAVFFCLGLIFAAIFISRNRKVQWLKTNGITISAEIKDVQLNYNIRMNNRHPWKIILETINPKTGQPQIMHSENLWFNPAPLLKETARERLNVWVDPDNYEKYLVDLTEIKARHRNLVSGK